MKKYTVTISLSATAFEFGLLHGLILEHLKTCTFCSDGTLKAIGTAIMEQFNAAVSKEASAE